MAVTERRSVFTDREDGEEKCDEEDEKLLSRDASCHCQTELLHCRLPHHPDSHSHQHSLRTLHDDNYTCQQNISKKN